MKANSWIYVFWTVLLFSCHIKKKATTNQNWHPAGGCVIEPEQERMRFVVLDTVRLDSMVIINPETTFYKKREEKIIIIPNKTGDLVSVFEDDTLVTKFRIRDYCIIDKKLKVYYSSGQLSYSVELADSIGNQYSSQYFRYFKAVPHGKSLYYWPNGNLSSIIFYRNGLNDTLEKDYYKDGKHLYHYMHKDTQLYFFTDGKVQSLSRYVKIGKTRRYKILEYWPKGKLKTEGYFTDKRSWDSCGTWRGYNEKGKLIRKKTFTNIRKLGKDEEGYPQRVYTAKPEVFELKKQIYQKLKEMLAKENIKNEGFFTLNIAISPQGLSLGKSTGYMPWDLRKEIDEYLEQIIYPREIFWNGRRMNLTEHYTIRFGLYE